jgi:hypothetical protein
MPFAVHSLLKAAIALGCAKKKAGFSQTSANKSSMASGVGVFAMLIFISGAAE